MIRSVCFLFFFLIIGGSCELQRQSHSKASIAFVTNGVASFWTIAAKGVENAGEKFKVAVSVHMPAEGISDQKRIIQIEFSQIYFEKLLEQIILIKIMFK